MEEGVVWQSLEWKDGTKYSGLTKNGRMHSHGVLTFPNKDRYEGMFEDGKMHGAGVYVWKSGMVYRGDWQQGLMHGCGTCIWKEPPDGVRAVEGKFVGDDYVGDIMPCSADDATDSAVDADMAAFQARSFQWWGKSDKLQQRNRQQHQQQPPPVQQSVSGTKANFNHSSRHTGTESRSLQVDDRQEQRLVGLLQRLATDRAQVNGRGSKE